MDPRRKSLRKSSIDVVEPGMLPHRKQSYHASDRYNILQSQTAKLPTYLMRNPAIYSAPGHSTPHPPPPLHRSHASALCDVASRTATPPPHHEIIMQLHATTPLPRHLVNHYTTPPPRSNSGEHLQEAAKNANANQRKRRLTGQMTRAER